MPQRLLLEGADLEALMLRAREEYGPEVRVVKADKVRTGGVLGFFAREKYELTLEISDEVAGAALAAGRAGELGSGAVVAAARSRDEAADAQLAEEIADAKAAREAMLADAAAPRAVATNAAVAEPGRQDAAAQRVQDVAQTAEPTDMAQFDELVLQLTEQAATARAEAPARVAGRARPRAFAPATFPGIDRDEAVVLRPALPATDPAPTDPASADPAPTGTNGSIRTGEGPYRGTNGAIRTGDGVVAGADAVAGDDGEAGVVVNRWGVFTDVATAVATECTAPALLALGVPARFVSGFADLDTPVPLLDVVARFGTPPVRRPQAGDVLLIAGPADKAVAVATQVAAWVGVPRQAVMLAGEIDAIRGHGRRIRTSDQARVVRRRAEEAARLGDPTIVALGIAPGRRGAAAAAELFAAVEADTTWAIVDGTKRASSYAGDLKLLGEHRNVDALAVVGISDAQAPGAVLDAPLPAAWMDGLPATGVVWAALLGERIAARE
ncbi:hypothetical protein LGT39_08570 [Demequina sp. TTPB684]|uniref:hypothetical protein n=1 Tax=unclassified Demequina TaxID=2620311 RepID=UPI001CF10121|nr:MULTISPECIES: hypothetical protein [unclassified Demequina]MCB2412898.1 hypothetical protein [Demequina sp. TTPB684]UPU87877.1 hypothetical protein LGT36_011545 [Demequina sp. TMPB413]